MNKKRVLLIYFLFLCAVLFLTARFYIIADNGSQAIQTLSGQYVRRLDIVNRLGFIFDRNGEYLDVVSEGYITVVDPGDIADDDVISLSEKLAQNSDRLQSYYYDALITGKPFIVVTNTDITDDYCKSFAKYKKSDGVLCHLLGYRNSDGTGITGIMEAYDSFLTEYSSGRVFARYRADARGRRAKGTDMEIFDDRYSERNGIYLTIDLDIQKAAERICSEHLDMGAVVVQDTNTGEIYAMVSAPSYKKENLPEYLDSDRGELLNRCMLGYTPGSVFKTVVSVAALSDKTFDPDAVYECKGYVEIEGRKIKCHNVSGHGPLDLKEAFAQSCNPYFIELGCRLGIEKIVETAQSMGIGQYDSVNLLKCTKGYLPKKNSLSILANLSVGQGEVLLSPLQVCSMMSTAATGVYRKPSIVVRTVIGDDIVDYESVAETKIFDDKTSELMKELLISCVEDGTGYRAESYLVTTAGKTATAQSGQIKDGKEVIHSWFSGFFPAESPRFTICVLCDGNGVGNAHPSEIFRLITEGIIQIENDAHE